MFQDKSGGGLISTVEEDRRHDCFENIAEEAARHSCSKHSSPDDQAAIQVQLSRNFRAYAARNDDGFDLGQFAFEVFRVGSKQSFANDDTENRVTQKLHTFIRLGSRRRDTGVCQGGQK